MTFPVKAFVEIGPAQLVAGSLLMFRDSWALIVSYEDGQTPDLLILGGERAGQLFRVSQSMPRCLAIAAPFSWFAAVEDGVMPTHIDHQAGALVLTARQPIIIGVRQGSWDNEHFAFGLDGAVDRDHQPYGAGLRYARWTAELQHEDRPYESIGRLFSVRVD